MKTKKYKSNSHKLNLEIIKLNKLLLLFLLLLLLL